MFIQQISTTINEPCGVGVFARKFEQALRKSGCACVTTPHFELHPRADVVVVQHEWRIIWEDELRRFCRRCPVPVILFPHTADAAGFSESVQGFIVLNKGVISSTNRPVLEIPHPANTRELLPRNELKRTFSLDRAKAVIGTSGFLTEPRYFPAAVKRLLPAAIENHWIICVIAPTHSTTCPSLLKEMQELQENYPLHVVFENGFLSNDELNLRLQGCDLLWCWTALPGSSAYSSGVAADMYGSGTRVVLVDKAQHAHVLGRSNVVSGPESLDAFMDMVSREAAHTKFTRHDPTALSWESIAGQVVEFIDTVLEREAVAPHVHRRSGFLQSKQEINAAREWIAEHGWLHHEDPSKDWDLANILGEIRGDVLDMGCYGSFVLPNLARLKGNRRLAGIDLRTAPPIAGVEIVTGDLSASPFEDASFDTITCLSVIEHGIDFQKFAAEAYRLLRPGGKLAVTFDYWEPKIRTGWGAAWDVMDQVETATFMDACHATGLRLDANMDWALGQRAIHHVGHDYTFGLLWFTKTT